MAMPQKGDTTGSEDKSALAPARADYGCAPAKRDAKIAAPKGEVAQTFMAPRPLRSSALR